ncbi:MAG: hypothetical protein LBK76_00105 [Verrucomicrobiales bacterium]|jgi:hypothetical protein|nr:hypothetical protein [Verrucomicrobiales bacterium]
MHDEGIVECGDILRASGLPLATWEKVYAADYVRAVIDLLKLTPQQDGETVNLPPDKFVVTFPQIGGMFLKA